MTDDPPPPPPTGNRRSPALLALAATCLLVAMLAVIVLVSRDESDEPVTTTTSTTSDAARRVQPIAAWRAEVQEGCQGWNRQHEHLQGAEPSTAEEALDHTSDVDALASGLAETLTQAGLPEDEREDAEELVALSERMAEAAGELATAARVADGTGVDDATEQIESLGVRINELAESLEVPACGGY